MEYNKRPLTALEQLQTLKNKSLLIDNECEALNQLKRIGFFRFATYLRPMEEDTSSHKFKPGSSFGNGIKIYSFDRDLRSLLFNSIQYIEVAFRVSIIENVSSKYGAFWYMNPSLFSNQHYALENLNRITAEVRRSKEDFITEYFLKYEFPALPPVWKTLEVASFGVLSKLYDNLKDSHVQKRIARDFALPQHLFLKSWIASLSVLRNCVAHHARIWNRKFPVKPQMPRKLSNSWIAPVPESHGKLYPLLCSLLYLLNAIDSENDFVYKFKTLLKAYPNIDVKAMGFPKDWMKQPLWKSNPQYCTQ